MSRGDTDFSAKGGAARPGGVVPAGVGTAGSAGEDGIRPSRLDDCLLYTSDAADDANWV